MMTTYQVKNVKTWKGMEGPGYSCTLYRDGVKVAEVLEEGRGGETRLNFLRDSERQTLDEFCATLPPVVYEWDEKPCPVSAEMYVGRLVDEWGAAKQLRRWCKTLTVFRLPGDKPGEYRTVKHAYDATVAAWLRKKYQDVEIVNETL